MINGTTLDFLSNLKANNDRVWFEAHKKAYQEAYADFLDMVVQLLSATSAFDPAIAASALDPKSCIMRINRDIRFSKDKTPYKTNFFAFINRNGRKSPYGGYYLHLGPGGESFAGGGIYMPEPEVLEQIRRAIDARFEEWQSIISRKAFAMQFPDGVKSSGKLARPPKGFDGNSPAIAYLKFKGYFTQKFYSDSEVTDPAFVSRLVDAFRSVKPLVDFINSSL
jgi:uncharacterized protein (TIGR02453 family)